MPYTFRCRLAPFPAAPRLQSVDTILATRVFCDTSGPLCTAIVSRPLSVAHMSQQLDREKKSNIGELARLRRVLSEEGIVDTRFVFCAVSLLALRESTPMYQHMTDVETESCSKKGELGRLRRVMSDAVIVCLLCVFSTPLIYSTYVFLFR